MKKTSFLLIVFVLVLSGCTPKIVELPDLPDLSKPEFIPFEEPHGVVDKADTATRWIINNLTITRMENNYETSPEGVEIRWNYQSYGGLVNTTVEKMINQKIADKIEEFKKYVDFKLIPTYEGMYVLYPLETTKVLGVYISEYSYFSFNNILSVSLNVNVTTNVQIDDGSPYKQLGDRMVFNFDLNTGEELHLSDLFVNGSNYIQVLNDLIVIDTLSSMDPDHYGNIPYEYKGGFTGIRGDVTFSLNQGSLRLCFNENYNEFVYPACIGLPFSELSSILAIGQRFMTPDTSLFINKTIGKEKNYLYDNNITIENDNRNGVTITKTITRDDALSPTFVTLRDKLISQGETTINEMILTNIETLKVVFSAIPIGPYMNVYVSYTTTGIDTGHIRTVKTYREDGRVLGYADIFKPGYDYKTMIKDMLYKYNGERFSQVYDLEEIFNSLQIDLMGYREYCVVRLSNSEPSAPTVDDGEFVLYLNLEEYKDVMILEKW